MKIIIGSESFTPNISGVAISTELLAENLSNYSGLKAIVKRKKIPLVIINHFGLDYVISYLRWLKPIHPIIKKILTAYLVKFYNSCDEVICPTETVKQELSKWGIKTPITAISNGVDLARFFSYSSPVSIRLKFHLPINPIVLYLGRIDKDKSIEVLMKAMPKVIKETNAHFVIAGIGDELPKIKKLAEEIYQISTVFAISSAIEIQSIDILEAMVTGLPIVAAHAGALPELVKNKKIA